MVKTIGNVQKDAQVRAVASGAITNGDTVVVNSDGTVSAISGTAASFSSEVTWTTNNPDTHIRSTFDSTNNRVVVVYGDSSNSGYGTAVVGTVSGDSISFGTPVVFESGEVRDFDVTFVGSGKVLVVYRNQSSTNDGTGRVGTVSGTSISFGSGTVFFTSASAICVTYDSNAGKAVVSYRKDTSPQYFVSNVATISGTSVSFGSQVNVTTSVNAYSERGFSTSTFDSNSNMVFVAFVDQATADLWTAVGTVSGTSISYAGSAARLAEGSETYPRSTFDSSSNKIIVAWKSGANGTGDAAVGTISGSSISFGTTTSFITGTLKNGALDVSYDANLNKTLFSFALSAGNLQSKLATVSGTDITFGDATTSTFSVSDGVASSYDSNSQRVVVSADESSDGKSVVYIPLDTNLTTDNFVGFADSTYADTQSALIDSTCSINTKQTGLTTGSKYYVQNDGTLSTEADDPSIEAGLAISDTEILVKG